MTVRCRITTLELWRCAITGPHAECLAGGVVSQCRARVHLDLGVWGQCAALAHLNLSSNQIGEVGTESLAGVLGQCVSLAHLNLGNNHIGEVGTGTLKMHEPVIRLQECGKTCTTQDVRFFFHYCVYFSRFCVPNNPTITGSSDY
jgi:hypothetical protein